MIHFMVVHGAFDGIPWLFMNIFMESPWGIHETFHGFPWTLIIHFMGAHMEGFMVDHNPMKGFINAHGI